LTGHRGAVAAVALSGDGRLLLSGATGDTTALLWDMTGRVKDGRFQVAKLTAEDLGGGWSDLAGGDAGRAYEAIWTFFAAPDQAVAWVEARFGPANLQQVAGLMAELMDDDFGVRERATAALAKQGTEIVPALRAALDGKPPAETQRRLKTLLAKLGVDSVQAEERQASRAVEVLEYIG